MRKILIIMSTFAPYNSCGSIPNTKLVKYLARQELDITLIANSVSPGAPVDEKLLPAEMERIRTFRVQYSPLFTKTFGKANTKLVQSGTKAKMKAERRPVRSLLVSLIKNVYYTARSHDWTRNAKRILRRELRCERFDVVYSSYPSTQTHTVARYAKRRGIAGAWVADFRDPMGYVAFDRFNYQKDIRKQHAFERKADHVTVVSEGALNKFRFPDVPDSKLSYFPNGYDPEDFSVSPETAGKGGELLRLFYAGSLYSGRRDLTVLFRAISELAAEGAVDPARIRVEYAGNEWDVLCGFAEKFGLTHICKNYGYVTRHQVMEIMAQIDATLVCSHNTREDQGVVTGKLFELLLVEKPILTVVTGDLPDSELGRIVKDCEAGMVFEEATEARDYPLLKQWLKAIYEEKQRTGAVASTLSLAKREQYSYQNIADKLTALFEALAQPQDDKP